MKLVMNAGNGSAGPVVDALEKCFDNSNVPPELIKIHNEPDGTFPNGIPNPILEENRESTIKAVLEHNADMGVAWDGDFDRCFLVDETGRFIEGYYIVGLLAKAFLQKNQDLKLSMIQDLLGIPLILRKHLVVSRYNQKLDMHLLKKRCVLKMQFMVVK